MKRDIKLVREILEHYEREEEAPVKAPKGKEAYVRLCMNAGFLVEYQSYAGKWGVELSWKGHDYLETLRR